MKLAGLAVLLGTAAAAQTGLPGYDKPPEKEAPAVSLSSQAVSASTAAVTASSGTVAAPTDEALHGGVKKGGGAPRVRLSRPMHATVHKDAADWEPIGVKEGGDPGQAETSVTLRLVKSKGKLKGAVSKAKATARVHKGKKDSTWLVVRVQPKSLEKRRTHFEIRLRIFEGFVEGVEAAAVTVTDRARAAASAGLDTYGLRAEGIEYQEEQPGSGLVLVSALDPKPSKGARNSGRLEKAEFADKDLGFVSLSWAATGVAK